MLPAGEYNLCEENWQPINLSNFAPNFAICQPNLHLKAHSYLSAAGRLHMLADRGLDCRWIDHYGLVELPPVEFEIGELTNCSIRPSVKLSFGELVFGGLTNCWMKIVEYPMFNLQLVAGLVTLLIGVGNISVPRFGECCLPLLP